MRREAKLCIAVVLCVTALHVTEALAAHRSAGTIAGHIQRLRSPNRKCQPCKYTLELDTVSLKAVQQANGKPKDSALQYLFTPQPADRSARDLFKEGSFLLHVSYDEVYDVEGWDRLEIIVNDYIPIPEEVKAHAAGYAEAFFTYDAIFNYWHNYRVNEFAASGGEPSPGMLRFIDAQAAYVRGRAAVQGDVSKYWRLASLVMAQFDGLVEGYQHMVVDPSRNLTWHDLYLLQSVGDLYDLNVLFPPLTPGEQQQHKQLASTGRPPRVPSVAGRRFTPGHGVVGDDGGYGEMLECSALIKLPGASAQARLRAQAQRMAASRAQAGQQTRGSARGSLQGDGSGDTAQRGSRPSLWAAALKLPVQAIGLLGRRLLRTSGQVSGRLWAPDEDVQQYDSPLKALVRQVRSGKRGKHAAASGRRQGVSGSSQTGAAQVGRTEQASSQNKREKAAPFWAGHTTWRPYYAMRRTWKVYGFPWSATGPVVVSSSPGLLHSKDDWYTTDRFVVMETTLGIYNASLYDAIRSASVLTWQRVMIANFGASTGQEWAALFAKAASGTYNNQWMVLDVSALNAGWSRGVLWVLEQIPGYVEKADVSGVLLSQGYWPSFNIPYFPRVYNLSGHPPDRDLYNTSPRARIFAREAPQVNSLSALKRLLRLNRFEEDALSEGRPNAAIAARYDLVPLPSARANWTRKAFGAVDAKAVDAKTFRQRKAHVICGPTSDDQPPFRWASSGFANISRVGVAPEFLFGWQEYRVQEPVWADARNANLFNGQLGTA